MVDFDGFDSTIVRLKVDNQAMSVALRFALSLAVENPLRRKSEKLTDQRHHSILVHPHLKNPGWLLRPTD